MARRWISLLSLCLSAWSPCLASAAEKVVVSFGGSQIYAQMWPGGTVSQGGEDGYKWLRVVSDGNGESTFVANVRALNPAIDATGKFVKVWFRVDDMERLRGMEFRLSSDRFKNDFFGFTFPIYDDSNFNVVRGGTWTTLTFSFGQATVTGSPNRAKLNAAGWYLVDQGGGKPVSALWGGLALVDEPLEGVVSITFDDGYREHHTAAQWMAPYGFRGTAYIIPEAVGQPGHMTLHQIVDLQEQYGWDIGAHHEIPVTDMTPERLEATILGIKRYSAANQLGAGVGHLAYPLGRQGIDYVRPLVRKHFETARVAGAGPETLPPADRHLLRAINVTDSTTPDDVGAAIERAKQNHEWLILMFHFLVDETKLATEYSNENFKALLKVIADSQVRVLPLSEVWHACADEIPADGRSCNFSKGLAAPQP